MDSINSLIKKLSQTYPQFNFEESSGYAWSPSKKTILYDSNSADAPLLLHELGHGLLGHTDYSRDINLIPIERDAWNKAKELAKDLNLKISDDIIENNLDTYRKWMHDRSTCPDCEATGLQIEKRTYQCPACTKSWRVNDARICGLKRYLNK